MKDPIVEQVRRIKEAQAAEAMHRSQDGERQKTENRPVKTPRIPTQASSIGARDQNHALRMTLDLKTAAASSRGTTGSLKP